MKKKITIASALLLATMASQFLSPAYVNAQELEPQVIMKKESSVEASKEIGAITITGIEETKIGSAYPKQAVVVADNGATWEIPVVWIRCLVEYRMFYPVFL